MEPGYVKLKLIKPLISGYIRESQFLLTKSAIPDDRTVHDVRVLMKKARSLLKLTAHQTDNPLYQRDMDALRNVGKILRFRRDNSVYRKTLKELKKENPEIFKNLNKHTGLQHLLEKPEIANEVTMEMKSSIEQINELLSKTNYRIRFQSMNTIDPHEMLKELESTYLIVANAYLRCRNDQKPASIHKFRKVAKDFRYQLFIFRALNPSAVRNLEKKLENLTINLGKFNDLVQLIKVLGYKYDEKNSPSSIDELILKIRSKQDKYLNRVWSSAFKIFCPGQKLVNLLGFKLLVI